MAAVEEARMSVQPRRSRPAFLLSGIAVTLLLISSHPARAQHRFTFQVFGGGAWNASTPLTIRQQGRPDVEISADWETKPFVQPLYWAVRASLEGRSGAWELQLLHDKLHLAHEPPEVGAFEITHGFNLVTLGRSFPLSKGFTARAGAGVVLAHAESTVRGEHEGNAGNLGGGYELTGPVFLAGAGWQLPLSRYLFVSAESLVTAAHARVPVARGDATFWNVALHGLIGLGVRFGSPLP
jgi:hypothetical protein